MPPLLRLLDGDVFFVGFGGARVLPWTTGPGEVSSGSGSGSGAGAGVTGAGGGAGASWLGVAECQRIVAQLAAHELPGLVPGALARDREAVEDVGALAAILEQTGLAQDGRCRETRDCAMPSTSISSCTASSCCSSSASTRTRVGSERVRKTFWS